MTNAHSSNPPSPRARTKRLRRALLVLGGLVAAYWLATDSFVTRWFVTSRLSRMAGGAVSASSVRVSPRGVVIVRDASLRAPGVGGQAGEVFRAKRMTAAIDLTTIFSASPQLTTLTLDHPVVRLSRGAGDGAVNIANLAPSISAATRSGGVLTVPELFVTNGSIELGEHAGGQFSLLKQLDVSGKVEQSADDSGASIINFRQALKPDADATGSLVVRGRIAKEGVSLTVTGLDLAAVTPANVPGELRELFRETSLAGTMPQATVSYLFGGGWESTITLANVALNLPVDAQPDLDDAGRPLPLPPELQGQRLRLEQTSGTLTIGNAGMRGALRGQIESLPYEVTFDVAGTSPNSPFTCTLVAKDVKLTKRPQILRFAPPIVRQRLKDFADPVGTIDATVTIARGERLAPGDVLSDAPPPPAPLRVEGTMQLKGLTAAFHKFPYVWKNLSGTVTFNEREVLIRELTGTADTGAKIVATGRIAPPNDDAGADLHIQATSLPVDADLRAALAARGQAQVYDELFSQRQYERLLEAGLVRGGGPAAGDSRTDDAAPQFTPGGIANVGVVVTREPGPNREWFDTITIDFPSARVLLDAIPYPLLASDVRIVQEHGVATVSRGTYAGLRGGTITLSAVADLAQIARSGDFVPDVEAKATGLPIEPLLLFALPDVGRDARPLGTLLSPMGPTGLVDATATLSLDGAGITRYDVRADVQGQLAPPPPRPQADDDAPRSTRVHVRDLHAGIIASDTKVEVRATGALDGTPPNPQPTPHSATLPTPLRLTLVAEQGGATSVRVDAPAMDLAWHVEDLLRPVAPDAAHSIAKTREEYKPKGIADLAANVTLSWQDAQGSTPGREVVLGDVTLMHPRGMTCVEPGVGTLRFDESSAGVLRLAPGASVLDIDASGALVAEGPSGDLIEGGAFTLTGTLDAASGDDIATATTLRDGQLAHPCVRGLVRKYGSPALADFLVENNVAGSVDVDVKTTPVVGRRDSVTTAIITPRTLEATRDATRILIPAITGDITLDESGGVFRDLRLAAPGWSLLVTGGWTKQAGGALLAQTQLSLDAQRFSPDLRALLPPGLRSSLDGLSVRIDGPTQLPQSPLALTWSADGTLTRVLTAGSLAVRDASADLGVKLTRAEGTLEYTYTWNEADPVGAFTLDAALPSVHAANIHLTDAATRITSTPAGEIVAPQITARAHGGRLTGALRVAPPPPGPTRPDAPPLARLFTLDVEASNVRFASVLGELRGKAGAPVATTTATDPPAPTPLSSSEAGVPDASRGVLTGSFSLTGATSDRLASIRRGRGTLQVRGGNVLDLPVLVPLVRATNLELPSQEPLDYAFADFYIQGSQISFEQIAISSKSAGLYGVGVATWPELALDLRFKAASLNRIPIITPLMESIRDELVLTRVLGTMDKPEVTNVSFAATKDALRDLFGEGKSAAQQKLDAIERGVRADERRARPDAETAIEPETP